MQLFITVPQNHCIVVERFGKYAKLYKNGLNFKIPFLDVIKKVNYWGDVANKNGYLIELSEQQTMANPRQCQTKDNVTVSADASIYWRIIHPARAIYDVDHLPRAIIDIALNALRANIGKMSLDEVLSQRQKLSENVISQLVKTSTKWGILFTRVEIQEVTYSDETAEAMMQEMTAERKKRAIIAEAKGSSEAELMMARSRSNATLMYAESKAKSLEMLADAEAEYLSKLSNHVDTHTAGQILVAQKYINSLETMAEKAGDKVFLPNNFNALFNINTDK